MNAAQGQQAAERMLTQLRAEHKADIETRISQYTALQAQVGMLSLLCFPTTYVPPLRKARCYQSGLQAAGFADHNEQMQKLVKQHTSELATVLEQRSQSHLDLKAS